MTDDTPVTRPDLDALIAKLHHHADLATGGTQRSSLFREAANTLAAERARADQAGQDAEAHARDAKFEREGRRKAEQRISKALAAVRRSQRSEWVRDLQATIQRISFADIVDAERILSAAPTTEQKAN